MTRIIGTKPMQWACTLLLLVMLLASETGCGTVQGYGVSGIPESDVVVLSHNREIFKNLGFSSICSNDTGKCVDVEGFKSSVKILPGPLMAYVYYNDSSYDWLQTRGGVSASLFFQAEAGKRYQLYAKRESGVTLFWIEDLSTKEVVAGPRPCKFDKFYCPLGN